VNSRIGAAGAVDARFAGKQLCQCYLDLFLHSRTDLLPLPALVGRAVVGDAEFEFL